MTVPPPTTTRTTEETPPAPPPPKLKDSLPNLPLDANLSALIMNYEGETDAEGRAAGEGKAKFIDGHTYEGKWLNGMMHGVGKYTFADGITYSGDFTYNCITGTGTYVWTDGSTYTGQVKDGLRHGKGVFTGPGGQGVYDGDWFDGKREGEGKLYYNEEKTVYYEGVWKANMRR